VDSKVLKKLTLSLQFGFVEDIAAHRAALPRGKVARWIRHTLERDAIITVRVVNREEGLHLNRNYRAQGHATNVLTFAYALEPLVSADIILCAPVVAEQARRAGKTLQAHYAHLVVHGTLHAQGWDHETDAAQAAAMEQREAEILLGMRFESPY
jgi:probable rRNA maturation factor